MWFLLSGVMNISVVESVLDKISYICGWLGVAYVSAQLRTLVVVLEYVGDPLQWVSCLIAVLGS